MNKSSMPDLLYKEEVYAIVGAAMEVYNELGPGFLEGVYQEAFEIELATRAVPFKAQQQMYIYYKGQQLRKAYTPDIFCFDKIVVDLKAIERLSVIELAQMRNYLKGTRLELGLLINFGSANNLEYKRVILSRSR